MKKSALAACLAAALLLACFPCAQSGLAECQEPFHQYLGISFQGTTAETVSQILLEEKGVPLEVSARVWSGKAAGIMEFGYEFDLQADFGEGYADVNRILLSSAQPARMSAEAFPQRMEADLAQFLDMERQLAALYGEPNLRFFCTNNAHYNKRQTWYMFPSGAWEFQPMLEVCQKDYLLSAYSIWKNVVLRVWIDWDEHSRTRYLSRVMLHYSNFSEVEAFTGNEIAIFPPKGEA